VKAEKVSISLDPSLLAEARRRTRGSLSAYVNDALRRKLLQERRNDYLDALDAELGAIPEQELEEARRWWSEVKIGS
jgi:Arc/MetJ family transcription regulator